MFVWNMFSKLYPKKIVNVTVSQKFKARSLKLLRAFEMFFSLVAKSWGRTSSQKTNFLARSRGEDVQHNPRSALPLPCSHHRRIVPLSLILLQLVVCALYQIGPRDPMGSVSCGKFPVGKLLTLKTKWEGSVVESGGFGGREVFVMSK